MLKNEVRSHHVTENKGSRFGTNPQTKPNSHRTKPISCGTKPTLEQWPVTSGERSRQRSAIGFEQLRDRPGLAVFSLPLALGRPGFQVPYFELLAES
jgi:hypothetical protein